MRRQVAALPYRVDETGVIEVLLITSRDTGRWIIPKGNRMAGLTAQEAAEREAFEEAGIAGMVFAKAIGSYRSDKQDKDGTSRLLTVNVFLMAVGVQFDDWPERSQRQTRWFKLLDAADVISEIELKAILRRLDSRYNKAPKRESAML